MPEISLLYTAILCLSSIVISYLAGSLRGKLKIALGDGGNPQMLKAMRRHANFVEYVPLVLILLALLELNGVSALALHIFGICLFVFRIFHAWGIGENMAHIGRFIGAFGTTILTLVMSIWALVIYLK